MAAFVSTTPLLTRPGFAGAAVARSPPSVAATVTMETAKSEAMPFMKKPEGLIPSQDGCTLGCQLQGYGVGRTFARMSLVGRPGHGATADVADGNDFATVHMAVRLLFP